MTEAATLTLPAGACDCHTHVVGPRAGYAMVAERHYTPDTATSSELRSHLARNGLRRAVIVQPSFYGTDNRCLLDSLEQLGGAGRGVAVVGDNADAGDLRLLHQRGIRALRINVESAGMRDALAVSTLLERWSERVEPLGWHLQIYASMDTISGAATALASLTVPVVLDHFAMIPADTPRDDPRARTILDLLARGNVYAKLSAPYRMQQDGAPDPARVAAWAQAFVAANSARILWGSDWPHTNREAGKVAHEVSRYRDIPHGSLGSDLSRWLPTPALMQQVLVDNPRNLYGF